MLLTCLGGGVELFLDVMCLFAIIEWMGFGVDILDYMFSFFCGQNGLRSFVICGEGLDFCQRCAGVYVGMGLTFLYFLVTGNYKRRVCRWIVCVNILSVLVMVVFGFHILDPGAGWRMWSGIVFGHAIVCLIYPGVWQFCTGGMAVRYSRKGLVWFFLFFVFLNLVPVWFPLQSELFYMIVNFLAVVGVLFGVVCGVAVLGSLIRRAAGYFILKGAVNGIENT